MRRPHSAVSVALCFVFGLASSEACSHREPRTRCDRVTCAEETDCEEEACEEEADPVQRDDAEVEPPDAQSPKRDARLEEPEAGDVGPDAQVSEPVQEASNRDAQVGTDAGVLLSDAGPETESPHKGSWLGKTSSGLEMGFTVTREGTIDSLILFVNLRVGLGICTAPTFANGRTMIKDGAFQVPLRFPAGFAESSLSGKFAADGQSVSGSYESIETNSIFCGSTLSVGTGFVVGSGTFTAQRGLLRCKFAHDGVCDEPEGTGACLEGADALDCDPRCAGGACAGTLDAGATPLPFDASILFPLFDGGLPPFFLDGGFSLPGFDASLFTQGLDAGSPFTFVDGAVIVSLPDAALVLSSRPL